MIQNAIPREACGDGGDPSVAKAARSSMIVCADGEPDPKLTGSGAAETHGT